MKLVCGFPVGAESAPCGKKASYQCDECLGFFCSNHVKSASNEDVCLPCGSEDE